MNNFRTTLFFKASASCSKIVNCENFFNTVYTNLGTIRVIWASVVLVCNWTNVVMIGYTIVTLIWTKPSFSVKIEQLNECR